MDDGPRPESISWLLESVDDRERETLARIFPLIYEELRQVAHRYMRSEQARHTLQPTALVNEAFLRVQHGGQRVGNRRHALAIAAVAMRHILVDQARQRGTKKRGSGALQFALQGDEAAVEREMDLLELDDLLTRFATLDPRRARVVELRFFAGMTNEEIAEALGVARSTVAEDWSVARAWLSLQLRHEPPHV